MEAPWLCQGEDVTHDNPLNVHLPWVLLENKDDGKIGKVGKEVESNGKRELLWKASQLKGKKFRKLTILFLLGALTCCGIILLVFITHWTGPPLFKLFYLSSWGQYSRTFLFGTCMVIILGWLVHEKRKKEKAEEKLAMLHEWTRILNQATDMEELFKYTLEAVDIALDFDFVAIGVKEATTLRIVHHQGMSLPQHLHTLPLTGKGVTVKAINTGRSLLLREVEHKAAYLPVSPKIKSELTVPIRNGEEVLGIIDLESTRKNAFSRRDERLMEVLSSYVAETLKKIRERRQKISLKRLDELREQFLAMAAHELHTPLSVVKAKTERLGKLLHNELTEEQQQIINSLLSNIDRLTRLIDDFRCVTDLRSDQFHMEKNATSFGESMREGIQAYEEAFAEEGIELETDFPETLRATHDEERMVQVIQNLVENAIDYTRDAIWIRGWEEGGRVFVSVRDNGPGIPEDEQEKIFEPFYRVERDRARADRRFGGTGLGLHICKRIVRAHGGRIRVESTPGEGSKFILTVPAEGPQEKYPLDSVEYAQQ